MSVVNIWCTSLLVDGTGTTNCHCGLIWHWFQLILGQSVQALHVWTDFSNSNSLFPYLSITVVWSIELHSELNTWNLALMSALRFFLSNIEWFPFSVCLLFHDIKRMLTHTKWLFVFLKCIFLSEWLVRISWKYSAMGKDISSIERLMCCMLRSLSDVLHASPPAAAQLGGEALKVF